jgi:DNA-binding NarL/FixJ family response regulator
MAIRIMLVDDHEVVRAGFRSLLDKEPDIEVVAEASDGREAVETAADADLDLIVMDVAMPGLNGTEAARRIVADCPGAKILALSMHPSQRVVSEMLRAGASGYLLKTCALEDLARAVRIVHSGRTYLAPEIAGALVDEHVRSSAEPDAGVLTAREREVLQLVAEGKSSKEIAAALHVSRKTVETHRQHIMDRLDLRSVAELTKYAVREGLTPLD